MAHAVDTLEHVVRQGLVGPRVTEGTVHGFVDDRKNQAVVVNDGPPVVAGVSRPVAGVTVDRAVDVLQHGRALQPERRVLVGVTRRFQVLAEEGHRANLAVVLGDPRDGHEVETETAVEQVRALFADALRLPRAEPRLYARLLARNRLPNARLRRVGGVGRHDGHDVDLVGVPAGGPRDLLGPGDGRVPVGVVVVRDARQLGDQSRHRALGDGEVSRHVAGRQGVGLAGLVDVEVNVDDGLAGRGVGRRAVARIGVRRRGRGASRARA